MHADPVVFGVLAAALSLAVFAWVEMADAQRRRRMLPPISHVLRDAVTRMLGRSVRP